jgi:hypothetical protein
MLGSEFRTSKLWRMTHSPLTIKDLYPDLPPEKKQEVEEVFELYLGFVLRTYEHIQADPHLYEEFLSLTGLASDRTMDDKGRSFTREYGDNTVV